MPASSLPRDHMCHIGDFLKTASVHRPGSAWSDPSVGRVAALAACDVTTSDSLPTLRCPSASRLDTNTSSLFQLSPALLSKPIAGRRSPSMPVTGHQAGTGGRVSALGRDESAVQRVAPGFHLLQPKC